MFGNEVERLEDDADMASAEGGELVSLIGPSAWARDLDEAVVRPPETARTIRSVDLPEPEGPTIADRLARGTSRSMPFRRGPARAAAGSQRQLNIS